MSENDKIKEILLNQMELIKQASEGNPNTLAELSEALCKLVNAYRFMRCALFFSKIPS